MTLELNLTLMSKRHIWGADGCCWRETFFATETGIIMRWRVLLQRFSGLEVVEAYGAEFTEDVVNHVVEGNFDTFPAWYAVPEMGPRLQLAELYGEAAKRLEILRSHPSQRVLWLEQDDRKVLLVHHLPTLLNGGKKLYALPQMRLDATEAHEPTPLLARAARDRTNPAHFMPVGAVYHPAAGHMLVVAKATQGLQGWLKRSPGVLAKAMLKPLGHGWAWVSAQELQRLAEGGFLSLTTAHVVQHMGAELGLNKA